MRNGVWKIKVVRADTPQQFKERLEEGFKEGYLFDGQRYINSVLVCGVWSFVFIQVMSKYVAKEEKE